MMEVQEDFSRPLPPGELALRKLEDPGDWPDIDRACTNRYLLDRAIANSLDYLVKPSSETYFPYGQISHEHAVASLEKLRQLLAGDLTDDALAGAIRRQFDVYTSVGWDGKGTVLFTGYYTPILRASRRRTPQFRYPLYSAPPGLVKDEEGEVLGVRTPAGGLDALPPRERIEQSPLLLGRELVWLSDPFEVYVAHVQGSAILKMPDGTMMTVGYDASNGHEYVSVGKALIADGHMEAEELSLPAMIAFFDEHPELIEHYTNMNPRFIFFRRSSGPPLGSLNEPVLPMRSIATDKDVYPRACLALVDAPLPRHVRGQVKVVDYTGFVLDQDTGGAIRAPGRCDIYMGIGPRAGLAAGTTRHKGRLYYLFLKDFTPPAE
jgi:membrane-bound lytic murein transglycosylase A